MAAQPRRRPGSPDLEKLDADIEAGLAGIPAKPASAPDKAPPHVAIPMIGYPRMTGEHPFVQKLLAENAVVKSWGRARRRVGGAGEPEVFRELAPLFVGSVEIFKQALSMRLRPSEEVLDRYQDIVYTLHHHMKALPPVPPTDPELRAALQQTVGPYKESMALFKQVDQLKDGDTAAAAGRRKTRRSKKAGRRKTRK